ERRGVALALAPGVRVAGAEDDGAVVARREARRRIAGDDETGEAESQLEQQRGADDPDRGGSEEPSRVAHDQALSARRRGGGPGRKRDGGRHGRWGPRAPAAVKVGIARSADVVRPSADERLVSGPGALLLSLEVDVDAVAFEEPHAVDVVVGRVRDGVEVDEVARRDALPQQR